MIAALHETQTYNPHLTNLQRLVADKQTALEWLIIAHSDPVMAQSVAESISSPSAAMLQIPQPNWDLDGELLPAALRWSVNETGIKHLLLVGHSQAAPPLQPASYPNTIERVDSKETLNSSYNRLLNGVQRVQSQLQQSKQHFTDQVNAVVEIEEVQAAMSQGSMQVHALFYLAQGGVFLRYHLVSGEFSPLGG